MRLRGIGRIGAVARRLAASAPPRALVLMYHRVAEASYDPHELCVTPRHFAEQLEVLRRQAYPLPLRDLERAVAEADGPARAVAVTFDDGYADNLTGAGPLLERFDVPATIFVASGYLGSPHGFWWDELEQVVFRSGVLPDTLELAIDRRVYRWGRGATARSDAGAQAPGEGRAPVSDDDPGARQGLYGALHELLQPLGARERRSVLDSLRGWAAGPASGGPYRRPLAVDEVGRLAAGGLVEIGAHSVSHPALPARPAAEQADEIRGSRTDLEAIAGRPVTRFAYPFGAMSELTIGLVREAGFRQAYGGVGAVRGGANPWQVPRLPVADCDGDQFARRLRGWFSRWPRIT